MKFQLIDDARGAWKLLSVNAMAIGTVLEGAWISVPDDLKAFVPQWLPHVLAMSIFVLGIAGRMIKQPVRTPKDDQPEEPHHDHPD